MTRVLCSSCRAPVELQEMGSCPACGHYLCRQCERHYDGYCQHCLDADSEINLL